MLLGGLCQLRSYGFLLLNDETDDKDADNVFQFLLLITLVGLRFNHCKK